VNLDLDQSCKATILEKQGFKIGVVSYTFGLNNYRPPQDRPYVVNRLLLNDGVAANDFQLLQRQIAYCHEQNVDFIIAQLHWGMEHEFYPLPEQLELAHHMAELGVDAIFGHHPHVIQPMEIYRTQRDPQRDVPIYYSLGNLVNYFSALYLCRSGVARLHLVKGVDAQGQIHVYVKDAQQVEVLQTVDAAEKKLRLIPAPTKFPIRDV
jgi:poly-gamma-glutamate synthesis protein (capsule biosynthesis protein)